MGCLGWRSHKGEPAIPLWGFKSLLCLSTENDAELVDIAPDLFSTERKGLNEEKHRLWSKFSLETLLPFLSEEKGRSSVDAQIETSILDPALTLTSCMVVDKSLNFLDSVFSSVKGECQTRWCLRSLPARNFIWYDAKPEVGFISQWHTDQFTFVVIELLWRVFLAWWRKVLVTQIFSEFICKVSKY